MEVEKLDAAEGASVDLDRVLLVADDSGTRLGTPTLAKTIVTAKVRGLRIFRVVTYLPSQLPVVASAFIFLLIFQPDFGIANHLLSFIGVAPQKWLFDPVLAKPTLAIMGIVWQSGKAVFTRALDGIDPGIIDAIRHTVGQTEGIQQVGRVRARWLGHRLHTEIDVVVAFRFGNTACTDFDLSKYSVLSLSGDSQNARSFASLANFGTVLSRLFIIPYAPFYACRALKSHESILLRLAT